MDKLICIFFLTNYSDNQVTCSNWMNELVSRGHIVTSSSYNVYIALATQRNLKTRFALYKG